MAELRLLSGVVVAVLLLVPSSPAGAAVHGATATDAGVDPVALPIAARSLTEARAATVEIITTVEDTDVGMAGSGAVVDVDRGLVVTNAHVVFGARKARVRTVAGQEVGAMLVAEASCDDLALLRLDSVPAGLRAFRIDPSIRVADGDPVTALGYPVVADDRHDEDATPTAGEVRPGLEAELATRIATSGPPLGGMIEHSAALVPGNSGGPLLNADGWLVGINTLAGADGLAGAGFAVPTDRVAQLLPGLAAGRGLLDLGWSLVPIDAGLWVAGVASGSPAAGRLERGDRITTVAAEPVANEFAVCEVLRAHRGDTVRVDGRRHDVPLSVELPIPA